MPELMMLLVSGHVATKKIPKDAEPAEVLDRFWKQPGLEGCRVANSDVAGEMTVITRQVVAFAICRPRLTPPAK